MKLRRATSNDSAFFFNIRNEEQYRKMSIHTELISWPEHTAWFDIEIQKSNHHFFVIEENGQAIGVLRIQEKAKFPFVAIALIPEARGHGHGAGALQQACQIASQLGYKELRAEIKKENLPSVHAFEQAGFNRVDSVSELWLLAKNLNNN